MQTTTNLSDLLIVNVYPWPLVDLRLDWVMDNPVDRLKELWLNCLLRMNGGLTHTINPS